METVFYIIIIIPIILEVYNLLNTKEYVARIKKLKEQNIKLKEINLKIQDLETTDELSLDQLKVKVDEARRLDEQRNELVKDYPQGTCLFGLAAGFYTIWTIVGLFTFQWPVFLAMIMLGAITYQVRKRNIDNVWILKIDGILSLGLLLFVLINAKILHIDVGQIVDTWIGSLIG